MKDRFKFRAWDGEYMRQDVCIEPDGSVSWIVDGYDGAREISQFDDGASELIVMKCIGLKDSNKVLVYDGDLVSNNYNIGAGSKEVVREVRFEKGRWVLSWIRGKSTYPKVLGAYDFIPLNYKVIGNIHQNPELLNK